jgi:threonylcarbamoyladenosine tRNA methylthiotransferase MtaB
MHRRDRPGGEQRGDHEASIRTAALVALGCKVNQAETRQWSTELARVGVELVEYGRAADLYIVNTCTVTHIGDKSSRQMIRRASRANPDGMVVVTGCYASVDAEAVAAIPGVDLVVPNDDKEALVRRLADDGLVPEPPPDEPEVWRHRSEHPGWVTMAPALERKARAFVKVQDGCNSFCTYCIVPKARGPQRSRPIEAIVQEIGVLYNLGYREAVLTGVQIGAYGSDWDRGTRRVRKGSGPTLTALVEQILAKTPMPRIRISSIQPQDWPNGFVDLWRDQRMCRHLHLPLQSGSDSVLKRMGRRYRTDQFANLVSTLRSAMPEVALTADVMVGFPGETDEEHRASAQFIREMGFYEQHIFRYSARPGTSATRMADDVPSEAKKRRSEELHALDRALRVAYRRRFLGHTMDVLWEERASATTLARAKPVSDGSVTRPTWSGLTDNYLRVFAEGEALEGTITPTRLDGLVDEGLSGEIAGAAVPPAAS